MLYISLFNGLALLRYGLGRISRGRALYFILLFALFMFSAFRFEVGCDWTGYWFQWEAQKYYALRGMFDQREPLWWAIMDWLQRGGFSYPWLNVVSSGIFFAGIHVMARRQPDPLSFLILLFPILIVNMPMSGIRQGAAIGIMCMAFVAFNDRKLIRYVTLTILATTIHSSAMLFLLLTPMVLGGFTTTNLVTSAFLAIPGAFLLSGTDDAEVAAQRYLKTGIDAAGAAFRVGLLFVSGVAFFAFFAKRWRWTFPQDYKLAGIGSLMMIAVIALVPISSVIGDRVGYYLVPIQAMIFARIPFLKLGRQSGYFTAAPYVMLALVFAVWTLNSIHFQNCYLPYQTWLFGFPAGRLDLIQY